MFGLDTLNVLIGLVTVYLAFGVACTAVVEALTAWFSVRSSNLEAALGELLAGQLNQTTPFAQAFYDHPLVQALSKGKDGRPSYIDPAVVGRVVEALVTAKGTAASLAEAVNALPGTPDTNRIKGLLGALVAQTGEDAAAFRKAVETHFDSVMDRAAGWFKRYAQNVALVVAAALVIGANVDTVDLATALGLESGRPDEGAANRRGAAEGRHGCRADRREPGQGRDRADRGRERPGQGEGAVGCGPGGR